MMSFVLVEDLLKRAFNQSSNKTKPFITINANQWFVISKKRFVRLVSFVFKERICKLSWIVIYIKRFVQFERFVFVSWFWLVNLVHLGEACRVM